MLEAETKRSDYRQRMYSRYVSEFTAHQYRLDKKSFDATLPVFRKRFESLLPADRSARMADVACGSGMFLYFLRHLGYREIEGVDGSPEQVELARSFGLPVNQGDAFEFLRSNPGSFDFVSSFDFVEHCGKNEVLEFLDLAFAALRPGGAFVVHTTNAHSLFGARLRYADFTHELSFTPLSLSTVLRVAGFSEIRVHPSGPVAHGFVSAARCLLWETITLACKGIMLVETGSVGDGIYTQAMMATAKRPPE